MRAFITGGAGFIGSSLAERLLSQPDNSVTIFDNFSWGHSEFVTNSRSDHRLRVISGDLLDLESLKDAMPGHDLIYHFASNPDISRGIQDTSLDLRQSVLATYNVLEAMRLSDLETIVFTSGSGVYGDVGETPTAEHHGPLLPVSLYGSGKLGAEALISAFCHLFKRRGYILRLANVVGPRQTHGVALDFIRKLIANPRRLTILGDGKQSKSYIYIDDVLEAIDFVLSEAIEPVNLFNVATDDVVEVDWIAQTVIKAMGLADVAIEHTGGNRGWPGDVPVVRLDASKLNRLGWQAKLSSRQAVELSVAQLVARLDALKTRQEAV